MSNLNRFFRLAEFKLLIVGVFLVGLVLGAVGVFSERIELAMQARTSALLGADAQLSSSRPIDETYIELAKANNLEIAQSVSFVSMAIGNDSSKLAGVRAVSSNYPLRGEIVLKSPAPASDNASPGSTARSSAPNPGEVWAASQLVTELKLNENSALQLGDRGFEFTDELLLEPEGGAGMLRLAPRIIMNLDDLDSTGLVTPASRVRFRLLLAGAANDIEGFSKAIDSRLKPYESWRVADIRQDEVQGTVGRIVTYIRLATLLTLVLSIITMALAAQGLWGRQVHEVALLRCLGQSHQKTLITMLKVYMVMTIPAALAGIVTGYVLQFFALGILEQATSLVLPQGSVWPLSMALIMCIVSVLAIIFPLLLSVKQVSTISLLRTGATDKVKSNRATIIAISLLIIFVTLFLAQNASLSAGVLGSFVIAGLALWSLVRLIIWVFDRLIKPASRSWYVAFKSLSSNSGRSAWLVSSFAVTIFALALLGIIRSDIFAAWQKTVPSDAPNLFMMNIKQVDKSPLEDILGEYNIEKPEMFPIIRGRIAAINDKPIQRIADRSGLSDEEKRKQERLRHEFNLTELVALPADNEIVAGSWFSDNTEGFSVESEIAELLGFELGDTLTLNITGIAYSAPITSIRTVKWENMKPNFYIIASPGLFGDAARNYITGVHSPNETDPLIHKINKALPNVTAIDLRMILTRFRDIVQQGGQAVSVILLFTMAATLLVLIGVLQGQRNARSREVALLKSMGASRQFVSQAIFLEFALLGALAGLVGGGLAMLCATLLSEKVFELSLGINVKWLIYSIALGTTAVALTGYVSTRRLLDELPIRLFSGSRN